jgi:hypothetical protein
VESLQKESTKDKFSAEFKRNWSAAGGQQATSIEALWNSLKDSLTKAANDTIGLKKRTRGTMVIKETLQLISERKHIKEEMLQKEKTEEMQTLEKKYMEKDKEVKKQARSEKTNYINDKFPHVMKTVHIDQ